MIRPALSAILLAAASPALSDGFEVVGERERFVEIVDGRRLTALGIALTVSPAGEIEGSAFGRGVTGSWRWEAGYFCREMTVGATAVTPNCQLVKLRGDTLRFIADRGRGDTADLRLR